MTQADDWFENHAKTLERCPGFGQSGLGETRPNGLNKVLVMKWIFHLGTPSKLIGVSMLEYAGNSFYVICKQ
jgi:hypothetical protein